MFIRLSDSLYPVSTQQIRDLHPNTSFTDPFSPPDGYAEVIQVPRPDHNPLTHFASEDAPSLVDGVFTQQWSIHPLPPEQVAENERVAKENLRAGIVQSTQARLDVFAQTRNYDSILSACTYSTSTNPTFAAEGQRCVELRDTTWAALYQILAQVQAGARPVPSGFQDIEPDLPVLTWE